MWFLPDPPPTPPLLRTAYTKNWVYFAFKVIRSFFGSGVLLFMRAQLTLYQSHKQFLKKSLDFQNLCVTHLFCLEKGDPLEPSCIIFPSMAPMGGGTLLFEGAHLIDAIDVCRCSSVFFGVRRCKSVFVGVRRCSSVSVGVRQCSLVFLDVCRCW